MRFTWVEILILAVAVAILCVVAWGEYSADPPDTRKPYVGTETLHLGESSDYSEQMITSKPWEWPNVPVIFAWGDAITEVLRVTASCKDVESKTAYARIVEPGSSPLRVDIACGDAQRGSMP